ncbi:unnamed protein product [Candidula unifasciata]|uniref:Antistasin-like domain-containing protein n=1 Tax=Candidula unifasciata TaxID=100452 RepID=A0A8S3ZG26_9EUPU|nr:unnamed protein product [Candidula unifasciata]
MKLLLAVLLTLTVVSGKPASELDEKHDAKRIICSLVMCDIYCPYGHAKDARGCPLCGCNDQTTTAIPVHRCPLVMCDIYCQGGLKVGADGCRLCQCNDIADV